MVLIALAAVAVVLMFNERLGLDLGLDVPGFTSGDMSNWGLLAATLLGLVLVCSPSKAAPKGKG